MVKGDFLGFEIMSELASPGFSVYFRSKKEGFLIKVTSQDDLNVLGYYTAGPCLGIIENTDGIKSKEEVIEVLVKLLEAEISSNRSKPDYWGIKDFIGSRNLPTKKLQQAFKVSFDYLQENYQDLWKFVLKDSKDNPYR